MRNPRAAAAKLPRSLIAGEAINELLLNAATHPEAVRITKALLGGQKTVPLDKAFVEKLRELVVGLLAPAGVQLPQKSTRASTPISAEVLWAWGEFTEDPDAKLLATWLREGAPLGYSQPIPCTGVFPRVTGPHWEEEAASQLARQYEGWKNHPSADEWHEDLAILVAEAQANGFISLFDTMEEAAMYLGRWPVLNKLGLIVKVKGDKRKARLIWDLRESGVNGLCSQGERIILPRLTDAAADAVAILRAGGTPVFFAIDIENAFHNVPAGEDKAFTAAAIEVNGQQKVLVYDVLVFGAVSSPTLWGRFASWLGRTLAAVNPAVACQIYVDDPIMVFDSSDPKGDKQITVSILWAAVAGFPIKMEKTESGHSVKWIGAEMRILQEDRAVSITIPADKVSEVVERITKIMARPVVGKKQLQSLAGALSFFASVVPLMRPFLGGIWAVLATDDGPSRARKLVHTKRIAHSMEWILALLEESTVPFTRVVRSVKPNSGAIIITDASTWGMGGVLLMGGAAIEYFSCPIPFQFTVKTGAIPGIPKHMALWEALCLLLAARIWLVRFPIGSVVRVKADNISALYLLAKGKAKSPELQVVAREIALDQAKERYEVTILQHINTKLNITADPLSRQHDPVPPPFPQDRLGEAKRIPIEVGPDFWQIRELGRGKSAAVYLRTGWG